MRITTQMKINAVLLVAFVGIWFYIWSDGQRNPERPPVPPTAPPPGPPPIDLSRMTMAQAVAHCHALWLANHWDQAPLALAWQPQRVDWYVLDGVDTRSMRHFSCTHQGIGTGARYVRVLQERVPDPPLPPRNLLRDLNLFSHYAAQAGSVGLALEAMQDPQDPAGGAPIERRWLPDGTPAQQGPVPAGLPLLFSQAPNGLTVQGLPRLKALTATDWLERPDAMFSMLGDQMPPEVRIAAIDVRPNRITVSIVGPVKSFDNKPPSLYGDASFDEYGVRDADWWYPRDSATNGCSTGHTLAEVKALFAQAANRDHPERWGAVFGCPQKLGVNVGAWTVHVPKKRRR